MWGSQGWSQWALQPAMFNDVPHEQIDWAELAKQWIQMQQTPPTDAGPPPAHIPPVSLPPPPGHGPLAPEEIPERSNPPLLKNPTIPGHAPELYHERPFDPPEPPGAYMQKGDAHFWNKPQWEAPPSEINDRLWSGPAMEQPASIMAGKETFDYGHVHDNPPLAMQTIDYNHMSEYSYSPQMYTPPIPPPPPPVPEHHYDSYWSQINASPNIAPIFLKKERSAARVTVEEDSSQIDAAKRKTLPAWIRDGLEKMEQERLKKIEKEKNVKDEDELSKVKQLRKDLNLKSPTTPNVPKSKFESDSEGELTEEIPVKKKSSILIKRVASPVEDTRTEEEKKLDLMLKVRRTLTEVLLSVTNSEMIAIAQEVYTKAKSKAPARQLASSTSLTSVAPALRGLASYDSGSEESEAEEEPYQNSSDSEEELYRKIKEKKKLFAIKEKKIIAELERKELEDKIDKEKMNNGTSEKIQKENTSSEEMEINKQGLNSDDNNVSPIANLEEPAISNDVPIVSENSENNSEENKQIEVHNPSPKESDSDSSSSSSESDSNSSETNKKKSYKESKKSKSRSSKYEDSSSKRDRLHKHSKNRDSNSPDRHKRGRSPERKSSSRKQKKTKRSESSSSSSSTSRRKKSSSKRSSDHSSRRERRSRSYEDRRYRDSRSPSKSRRKSDSHSHKSSRRYHEDKHDRKYKEEKRHKDSRRSPSPYAHSSKVPRKYRYSRSLSSETESSGKKSKRSRNR